MNSYPGTVLLKLDLLQILFKSFVDSHRQCVFRQNQQELDNYYCHSAEGEYLENGGDGGFEVNEQKQNYPFDAKAFEDIWQTAFFYHKLEDRSIGEKHVASDAE